MSKVERDLPAEAFLNRVLRILETVLNLLTEPWAVAAGLGCAASVLIVVFEVVNRYGQLSNVTIAEEMTGYLLAFVTVFAAGSSLRKGHFPELTFVVRKLGERTRQTLILLGSVTGFSVNAAYLRAAIEVVRESIRIGATSWTTLYIPIAVPQAVMLAGFALFQIVLLALIIKAALELIARK